MRAGLAALILAALAAPAAAQLGLPGGLDPLGTVDRTRSAVSGAAENVVDRSVSGLSTIAGNAGQLAQDRLGRLRDFVAARRGSVDWDERHEPARAGELLLLDPDAALRVAAVLTIGSGAWLLGWALAGGIRGQRALRAEEAASTTARM